MKRKREILLQEHSCRYPDCPRASISVYGGNIYCREHTQHLCCMSGEKNIFNETRCNSVVPMLSVNGKMYCNSHYRTVIQTCNHKNCTKSRTDRNLCYDKKWYCQSHQLDNKKFEEEMNKIFAGDLNKDIVENICNIHFKNNTYIL